MKNNSLAMLATVALAGLVALLLGYFDVGSCVVPDVEGIASCQDIANQRTWAGWILFTVALVGFTVSAIRRKKR
ncbi:MAG: hypothetical protein ACKOXT_06085 [Actinomycetota bacterium]